MNMKASRPPRFINVNGDAKADRTNMNVGPAARAKSSTVFEIPTSSDESTVDITGGCEDSSEATLAMMGHNLSFSTPDVARGYKKVEGLGVFGLLNTESEEKRKYPVPFQYSGHGQDHRNKGRDSNENYRYTELPASEQNGRRQQVVPRAILGRATQRAAFYTASLPLADGTKVSSAGFRPTRHSKNK
jgi:hypothetical protein